VTLAAAPHAALVEAGPALHIPDGFVSAPVAIAGWLATAAIVAYAARRANRDLSERAVPFLGVMSAFIFAAQMMNFPVAGGTSGHMLGGALAAILLGPWAGIIVMTSVVSLQAFLFQDGGLVALGVNVFNMGILTSLAGFLIYRGATALLPARPAVRLAAVFTAAWLTVEVAAIATALQLAASATSPLNVALPAMVGVHALIGIGEGLISAAALAFVVSTRPDLAALAVPAAAPVPAGRAQGTP
jgi:cobalt/nickel transport system permease protein